MIYFNSEETRISIACLELLKNDEWLKKAAIMIKTGANETTLFISTVSTITLKKSDKKTLSNLPLYFFTLTTNGQSKDSGTFEIYEFEGDYSFSFSDSSVRTAVFVYSKIIESNVSFEEKAKKLEVGTRMHIPLKFDDDIVVYVEKDSNNSFHFVKKVYSIVTFTYESCSFKII